MFGPHIEPGYELAFTHRQVSLGTHGPASGIYTAATERNMPVFSEIGVFSGTTTPIVSVVAAAPSELCCPRIGAPNRDWYLNVHELDGVVSIRLFSDSFATRQLCLGILLCYEDGHQESLGQVRPDRPLDSPINLR